MPLKMSSIKAFLTLCLLALKKYLMVFGTEKKGVFGLGWDSLRGLLYRINSDTTSVWEYNDHPWVDENPDLKGSKIGLDAI
jgi:hypothetical protein